MDERMKFVAAVLAGEDNMSALCKRALISRRVGYKWLARYAAEGPGGLEERKRGPRRVPWAITEARAEAIIGLRRRHPSWGPKKLRAKLLVLAPGQQWPALSTIGDLLQRKGLSQPRKRRRTATPTPGGVPPILAPNDVWSTDFKGWFRTGDGRACYPLTVSDAFSRYLLCCRAITPDYEGCRREFERLFRECGLPRVLLSDNGPPFASLAAGGLSRLSVWWIKLGIMPVRIEPGQPQQNGRHERMHRTLKAETARPPAATLAAQQLCFDRFRAEFNHERPHEALGQAVPAAVYAPAQRPYPAHLDDPVYAEDYERRRVRSRGEIKWQGELIFIAEPLIGEVVGLHEDEDGNATVYFGPVQLGTIDGVTLKFESCSRRLRRRRRVAHNAHSPWDRPKNPGCGLVDNSPLHETNTENLLPNLPD